MQGQLVRLAYDGQWKDVLALLGQQPDLANAASTGKGYTPLHQAAWHGAGLPVIGALLALGADRRLSTKEGETARDIARSRHPDREDLQYILSHSTRSLAQLLRKLIAETPGLFSDYDGNRLICDRLIACLGETWDEAEGSAARDATGTLAQGLDARLEAALHAITGLSLPPRGTAQFRLAEYWCSSAAADFVRRTLLPPLHDLAARAALIPLNRTGRCSPICSSLHRIRGACGATSSSGWTCVRCSAIASFLARLEKAWNARSRIGWWLPSPR